MNVMDWAREQCRLYTLNCYDPDEQKYRQSCCESALKALQSLVDDGHSGMSFYITKDILTTLMNARPLVKIEDKPDMWIYTEVRRYGKEKTAKVYYHKYYNPLIKYVVDDGTAIFSNINRVICRPAESPNAGASFTNGFITKVVDSLFPITFPYDPTDTLTACVSEYLTDPQNGDFDTMVLECVIPKHGATRLLDFAYKQSPDGWVKIDHAELTDRIQKHIALKEKRLRESKSDSRENLFL